jgi:hypothetical protein
MPQALLLPFAVRPYQEGDLDALERIERLAGNACWDRDELQYFAARLDVDVRVIATPDTAGQPIAFYAVEHGEETLYLANIAVAP